MQMPSICLVPIDAQPHLFTYTFLF